MTNHSLNTIADSYKDLEKIETFDPNVFISDNNFSQPLCNFMLSLSLFCNDIKDIMMFQILVQNDKPKNQKKICSEVGQYGGLMAYFQRLYVLKIKELSRLLEKSVDLFNNKEFKEILRKLPAPNREFWNSMVNILARNKKQRNHDEFWTILTIVRDTTSGHYDPKELSKGYNVMFIKNKDKSEPYISGGDSISATRFYFADAVAQIYYYKKQKDLKFYDFDKVLNRLIGDLSKTIWLLIFKFINYRSTWKKPSQKNIVHINELEFD